MNLDPLYYSWCILSNQCFIRAQVTDKVHQGPFIVIIFLFFSLISIFFWNLNLFAYVLDLAKKPLPPPSSALFFFFQLRFPLFQCRKDTVPNMRSSILFIELFFQLYMYDVTFHLLESSTKASPEAAMSRRNRSTTESLQRDQHKRRLILKTGIDVHVKHKKKQRFLPSVQKCSCQRRRARLGF